jgi:hypothetical protein
MSQNLDMGRPAHLHGFGSPGQRVEASGRIISGKPGVQAELTHPASLTCIIHEGIADSVLGGTRLLNTAPAA